MAKKVLSLLLFLSLILAFTACAQESETPEENNPPAEPTAVQSGEQERITPDITPTESGEGAGQESRPEGELPVFSPTSALGAAIRFLLEKNPEMAIPDGVLWEVNVETPEPAVLGASTFVYTSGPWVTQIQFPIVLPELTIYRVDISNSDTVFEWLGEVDAYGKITELSGGGVAEQMWRGVIHRNPAGYQSPYMLIIESGEVFAVGSIDERVQEQIEDAAWSGATIEVWGTETLMPGNLSLTKLNITEVPPAEIRNLSPFAKPGASSELPPDREGTYFVWSLIDGLPMSPWCEGVEGPGAGEWVQLTFPEAIEITHINLVNGYVKNDLFGRNNRVREITFEFSDGQSIDWSFEDEPDMQTAVFAGAPGPMVVAEWVKVTINSVYPGSNFDDTCIGEMEVWGKTAE